MCLGLAPSVISFVLLFAPAAPTANTKSMGLFETNLRPWMAHEYGNRWFPYFFVCWAFTFGYLLRFIVCTGYADSKHEVDGFHNGRIYEGDRYFYIERDFAIENNANAKVIDYVFNR